jgi:hypothetical protein
VTLAGGKLAPAPAPIAPDLAAWRSLAEDESPESSAPPPLTDVRPRLARVSPSELCQVADCPEVPRLVRFSQGELHHVARSTGAAVTVREVPGARRSREAVGRRVPAVRLGKLVHLAIERATLREAPAQGADEALAREVLTGAGETEHRDALAALVVDTLSSVRGVAAALGATEEPWSEVPFAIDLDGTTLHGIIDLVVPGDGGLHVVDLKTHLMARDELVHVASRGAEARRDRVGGRAQGRADLGRGHVQSFGHDEHLAPLGRELPEDLRGLAQRFCPLCARRGVWGLVGEEVVLGERVEPALATVGAALLAHDVARETKEPRPHGHLRVVMFELPVHLHEDLLRRVGEVLVGDPHAAEAAPDVLPVLAVERREAGVHLVARGRRGHDGANILPGG